MMNKRSAGKAGEDDAAEYLEQKGYEIVRRNYYTRYGEIDIIAKDGDCLVFAEVKKRNGKKFGTGAQAVTSKKMDTIRTCALIYLSENGLNDQEIRFDVIDIESEKGKNLNHIKAAF